MPETLTWIAVLAGTVSTLIALFLANLGQRQETWQREARRLAGLEK